MALITLLTVESFADRYIPHSEELFNKYKEALIRFPDIEDNCYIEYLEPEEGEDEPGIHVYWANETPDAFTDASIYYASPLDLSTDQSASLEELNCLHKLIGDFSFYISGVSSHGDYFDSKVYVTNGQVCWDADWR